MSEYTHTTGIPAFEDIRLYDSDITVRRISLDDLWACLRLGLDDFNTKPSVIPLLFLFFPLFVVLFSLFALGQDLRYLVFPVVAGFTLVGPMVAVVFFAMSRHREQGVEMTWSGAFSFIHTHSFAPILALSVVMMVLYGAWLLMAEFLYFGIFGDAPAGAPGEFLAVLFGTRDGWGLILYGNITGFFFAYAAMAVSVVSFPLALDKPVTAWTAMKVSIRAFTSNFLVLAVWGIVVAALMALGTALFFMGLPMILPILGHATWHLYRCLVA